MQVEKNILEILERSALDGAMLRLPAKQLDRPTYQAVNKVIEAAGGRWDRKARAHLFDGDAIDTIDPILLTGEYTKPTSVKQDFGQFDSPPSVVARVIELARIEPGMDALEPSAGVGRLALAAAECGADVMCYEIDEARCDALVKASAKGVRRLDMVIQADFLTADPAQVYDRVVMNPPFAKQADITHVMHAAKFLKPSGRLVSIMSAAVKFRGNNLTRDFREMVEARGGAIEDLPDGAFKESGTNVNAVIVHFNAAA